MNRVLDLAVTVGVALLVLYVLSRTKAGADLFFRVKGSVASTT